MGQLSPNTQHVIAKATLMEASQIGLLHIHRFFFSQQGIMKPFKDAEMEAAEKCQTGAYWYLMPGTMNDSTGGTF